MKDASTAYKNPQYYYQPYWAYIWLHYPVANHKTIRAHAYIYITCVDKWHRFYIDMSEEFVNAWSPFVKHEFQSFCFILHALVHRSHLERRRPSHITLSQWKETSDAYPEAINLLRFHPHIPIFPYSSSFLDCLSFPTFGRVGLQ